MQARRSVKKKVRKPVVAALDCHVRIVTYTREVQDHDWQSTATWFACSRCGQEAPAPHAGAPNAGPCLFVSYADKFERLIRICDKARESRVDTILVATPAVLGDTYAEILESLHRIAKAGLVLSILSDGRPS